MERNPLLFSFLIAAVVIAAAAAISHALSPTEAYWQKMLPNTPMPEAIRNLVNPEMNDEKAGTDVGVGKGEVHVNAGKGGTTVDVGKGSVNVNTGHKGKPVVVSMRPGRYPYSAAGDQLHDDPTVALFFLEKDLHPGTKMNLLFSGCPPTPKAPLNGPPINSKKLPEILSEFSIKPQSLEAEAIKETLNICSEPAEEGVEDKFCPTTLESMIDFAVSKLGNHVEALTTTGKTGAPMQEYTIASGVEKMKGPKSVSCHRLTFVYPVYYCHEPLATTAYVVPLVGADGSKAEAVAVCHKDTSAWNPRNLAFHVLKVKPGTVPVCHFVPQDNVVWAQN